MNLLTRVPDFVAYVIQPYWTERNIFACALIMSWVKYLWYRYLSYRRCKVVKATQQVPPELADIKDQETFSNARLYQLDKMEFCFYRGIWDMLLTTVIFQSGGICFVWRYCEELAVRFGALNNELVATCLLLFVGSLASALFGLPWSIYYTFVIEQRHGFNKQFISFIYMDYIAPLFDKFTPLPEGQLKTKIERRAGSVSFPLKEILVVAGSKRSSQSNAYFSGVIKKKIVLFDTLFEKGHEVVSGSTTATTGNYTAQDKALALKKAHSWIGCNDDEILGIRAHELGHWKHAHVTKMFIIRQVYVFLSFMAISKLFADDKVYRAFLFDKSKPIFIGLNMILGFILSPCNTFVSILMTVLGRHFEFQADSFARHMQHASSLRGALIKINRDNLGFRVYDWLYSSWRNSHPPVLERVRALDKID